MGIRRVTPWLICVTSATDETAYRGAETAYAHGWCPSVPPHYVLFRQFRELREDVESVRQKRGGCEGLPRSRFPIPLAVRAVGPIENLVYDQAIYLCS